MIVGKAILHEYFGDAPAVYSSSFEIATGIRHEVAPALGLQILHASVGHTLRLEEREKCGQEGGHTGNTRQHDTCNMRQHNTGNTREQKGFEPISSLASILFSLLVS